MSEGELQYLEEFKPGAGSPTHIRAVVPDPLEYPRKALGSESSRAFVKSSSGLLGFGNPALQEFPRDVRFSRGVPVMKSLK